MQISLAPLRYSLARMFNLQADFRAARTRTWTIAPESVLRPKAPIMLPDEIARVHKVAPGSTVEIEDARLFAREISFPATEVLEISNAVLIDEHLFAGRSHRDQTRRQAMPRVAAGVSVTEAGLLSCNQLTNRSFGHWLTDQLATELIADHFQAPAVTCGAEYGHAPSYRQFASLPEFALGQTRIRRLLLPRDSGQNESRIARQKELRSRLRSRADTADDVELVYLKRGQLGARRHLANEERVADWVAGQGGTVLAPESMSVPELLQGLGKAKVVIGVAGGALAHALMLMPATSALLVIQPPDRFHNVLKTYTDGFDQRYALTVADAVPEGFSQPLDRLEKLVERTLTAVSSTANFTVQLNNINQ